MNRHLLVCLSITACVPTPEEDDLGVAEQALTASTPQNPLDPPRPAQGVAKLASNQLSRLSVGRFQKLTITLPAGPVRFRTACAGKDTGLYVVRRETIITKANPAEEARFNDDCSSGCLDARNSAIDFGTQDSSWTYDAYPFSNTDDTFSCQVQYSTSSGSSWTPIGGVNVVVGAKLVDVGAIKRDATEFFEVKTLANEPGGSNRASVDTEMMLFDVGVSSISATGVYRSDFAPLASQDQSASDLDPRIGAPISSARIESDRCRPGLPCLAFEPRHFLVIGTRQTSSIVDATVDLVRGPANVDSVSASASQRVIRDGWSCTTNTLSVAPGTYQAHFDAVSTQIYGSGNFNDACQIVPDSTCGDDYLRGFGNSLAFRMKLQRASGSSWIDVPNTQRDVTLGSFGSGGIHRKIIDLESMGLPTATYALCFTSTNSAVTISTSWSMKRNPRYSELKVATANLLHWDSPEAEHKNISNLFLTRGRRTTSGIRHDADQAPFQWNADIVAFQEKWGSSFQDILEEAEYQSDLDWHFNYGMSKSTAYSNTYSALFTHEYLHAGDFVAPGSRCAIRPSGSGVDADHEVRCYQHDHEDESPYVFHTYSVPATTAVKRWNVDGVEDQPIMVYNVQLEPWGQSTANRQRELDSLIDTIAQHLANEPGAFNTDGSTAPTNANNRIMLVGDFNMYAHEFGENRWLLRRLRERFGFAIDAAAANPDSYAQFHDMHDLRGQGMNADGRPANYMSINSWNALPDGSVSELEKVFWWSSETYGTVFGSQRYFPYWARTQHGTQEDYHKGGERNDAIFLVGRGWQQDDPVRKYVVMNTTTQGDSPFALHDASGNVLGVDIWYGYSDTDHDVPNDDRLPHYRPNYDVTSDYYDGCANNGCGVYRSDHIPVAARIRVTQ